MVTLDDLSDEWQLLKHVVGELDGVFWLFRG
jgi:hypothetical protein